jgi:predicted amidohydrolase YtcJ
MRNLSFLFSFLFLATACSRKENVDAIYYNAVVYTVDSAFTTAESFAVKDGKIVGVGSRDEMSRYAAEQEIDLGGAFVYPGLHDAHCHFYGYGVDLKKIWLTGTTSFAAIIDTLHKYREQRFMGWVFGRGWDQNDWENKAYPDRQVLDSMFPDVPVFLMRIDGHAALVNGEALRRCSISAQTRVEGGEVVLKDGVPSGLLIDNAVDIVKKQIPEPGLANKVEALLQAEKNCFAVGLTSLTDAGLDIATIELIDSLHKAGQLKMRMNTMVSYSPENAAYYKKKGVYRSERLGVNSFKLYADGALGSRGACLIHAYTDLPGHHGFLLNSVEDVRAAARTAKDMGFQLNTHCIGDSANRLLLTIYGEALGGKNDLRWRIEHAQVVDTSDFSLFAKYAIIPSVQPTHATSDMYWAPDRLGPDRMRGAYAYKRLLTERGMLAAGSDFPVEHIDPLYGFYAAVVRRDQAQFPPEGFQPDQALSREQALRAMTIWAAYASFEEKYKGSIEPGKWADFVVLDQDLMKAPDSILYRVPVRATYLGGEKVYSRP